MKLSYRSAILFSGLLWLAIGILLLIKGINYLVAASAAYLAGNTGGFFLLSQASRFSKNPEQAILILFVCAMILGLFKGRVVLKKTVNRVVSRIRALPAPIPFTAMYSKGYLMIIGGMTLMGMTFKFLPLPLDLKGFIDFTIGAALINGAMLYVRAAFERTRSPA